MVIPVIQIPVSRSTYNLTETLHSGQAFRWNKNEIPSRSDNIWHEGVINGIRVRLTQSDKSIRTIFPESSQHLKTLLPDYLAIDHDLQTFYSEFSSDKHMAAPIKDYRGLHILRQDPWECLIAFICSANNNIPRIKSLMDKISEACGNQYTDTLGKYYAFPTPKQLNDFGEQSLRNLGLGFRAKYVSKASAMVHLGDIDLPYLRTVDYHNALTELVKIPGVGDKVANCVLLFSLEKLESFPVDVWINRVMRETYMKDAGLELPNNSIREWAQSKFGIYAGYINQYLFHSRRLTS